MVLEGQNGVSIGENSLQRTQNSVAVEGLCESRFAAVREAFEENFRRHDELGAAISVVVDGVPAVDLWGGYQDEERTEAWQSDTLVNVFSITKGATALCLAMLVDRDLLDVNAPVGDYWPEFACDGKQNVTVAQLLSHQGGLPALRDPLPDDAHLDWGTMTQALSQERPWWSPGRALGYHAHTWGWLAGELVRRIDGRSGGQFLREEIVKPLGLDFYLGTPSEIDSRTALIATDRTSPAFRVLLYWLLTPHRMPMRLRLLDNPKQCEGKLDSRAWRAAEMPASNGISNARALAQLYGVLARGGSGEGVRLLGEAALASFTQVQAEGRDLIFGFRMRFGVGFMLDSPDLGIEPDSHCFGHTGAGGGFAFADPDRRIGFAYTPNQPHAQTRLLAEPARNLIRGIYASL